ncbi:hypothetical protein FN846DRAFT_940968 [Sphaerosporella brunnea]|uniref:Mucoidy inhibitor A n=1 Tax=Sphaerosporella brunnea TaxID=1250544 RepID=A0A5J5F323_9PEZI|nr:hypothetical protein FN846DRAFT_940968 [Sphaerosporella brunnea]
MSIPDDRIHYQTFNISDLSTRSVTIYPTRAAVVRDIENVLIKPGRTEITINNLTPHADEHSIKVEGHGTNAIVTDMTVDLVPNRNVAADISDDSDSSESEDEEELKSPELKAAIAEVIKLTSEKEDIRVAIESWSERADYLIKSMTYITENVAAPPDLDTFAATRDKLYQGSKSAVKDMEAVEKKLEIAEKRVARLQKQFDRERKKPREARRQRRLARADRNAEKKEQQLEIPERVYRVRITVELEVLPSETRTVIASAPTGKPRKPEDDVDDRVNKDLPSLRISYITGNASWTPHYDLRLDTTQQSGTLSYKAHFTNRTGEVWRDAKVTLSTSQNTFSGLNDKVPWMSPWNVTLVHGNVGLDGGLLCPSEQDVFLTKRGYSALHVPQAAVSRSAVSAGGFKISKKQLSSPVSITPTFYAASANYEASDEDMAFRMREESPDRGSTSKASKRLRIATSSAESHGMTTIYELPGTRTVTSSKLTRRHIITELDLPKVEFSHISVPKLRATVFLKARVFNQSSISLLCGKAGLTLDGSYMGTTTVPLCVPNDHFDIGLGVDESIQISYSKPVKKSSQQGLIMMKENVVLYNRSIRIHNARQGPVKLLVLDQVPVSDDERLRIGLVTPKGLRAEGDTQNLPGKMGTVRLKKNGEVWWELDMLDGGDITLPIEYEARCPAGMGMKAKYGDR